MKRIILLSVLIVATLYSMGQKTDKLRKYNLKHFSKRNYFYQFTTRSEPGASGTLKIVYPNRPFWGSLKDDATVIVVKPDRHDTSDFKWKDTISISVVSAAGSQLPYIKKVYFPEIFYPTNNIDDTAALKAPGVYKKLNRVKYTDYKFILQAMSIPLKFRPKVDTIPYTTETGVNIALGGGIKWAVNWYTENKTFLGQKTNSISFTPGVLVGLSATAIKGKVTASASFKDRTEPILSYGFFFMFGLNNINIGFSTGKDIALKDGGKAGGWIYNHKRWTGLTIGLDVIK